MLLFFAVAPVLFGHVSQCGLCCLHEIEIQGHFLKVFTEGFLIDQWVRVEMVKRKMLVFFAQDEEMKLL